MSRFMNYDRSNHRYCHLSISLKNTKVKIRYLTNPLIFVSKPTRRPHHRTPPPHTPATTPPFKKNADADLQAPYSPVQLHSASAGCHLPENCANPNYNAGEEMPLPALSNYPILLAL